MPTAAEIKQRIEASIPGAKASVEDYTGGGDHFRATVTSPAFAGRSRIEQHKLVYDVFGDEIGGPIHALSLKTQAHEEGDTPHVEGQAGVGEADEQQVEPGATGAENEQHATSASA